MHEMHERWGKEEIETTYQRIWTWKRPKYWREEGLWWKEGVWIERKERKIEIFEYEINWVEPQVYIETCILIDREVSKMCWEQNLDKSRGIKEVLTAKNFDGSRRCRASIEQKKSSENWLDGSSYLSRGIEQTETGFFKEEKHKTTIVSKVAKNMRVVCETFARKHKCLILWR